MSQQVVSNIIKKHLITTGNRELIKMDNLDKNDFMLASFKDALLYLKDKYAISDDDIKICSDKFEEQVNKKLFP